MRQLSIWLAVLFFLVLQGRAQVKADLRPNVFFSPKEGAFIEINYTVLGTSLSAHKVDGRWQNSVLVNVRILQDEANVKTDKYNLHSPFFTDSAAAPTFVNSSRYPVSNGKYQIEISLKDYKADSKTLTIKSEVNVQFGSGQLSCSSVQPLERYRKATINGPLTKSGFELVPYNSDYYPAQIGSLGFYWEVYNTPDAIGASQPMLLEWYLETEADSVRMPSYGAFSREQTTAQVNVLLSKADINHLGSGQYALVTQLKDQNNVIRLKRKYYFTRVNEKMEIVALQTMSVEERQRAFTGNSDNADTLKMFVECLWPIADNTDKEKIVDKTVKKDKERLKEYLVDFWQRRAADTGNALNMWISYYQKVRWVNANFKCGKQKGYYTDRGRVFLQYGSPNARAEEFYEPNTYPYEIWHYYRITDGSTGNFFSNRKFVFVNKNLGDYCYELVHSDMRGEFANPRWQLEVARKNLNGAPESRYNETFQNPH